MVEDDSSRANIHSLPGRRDLRPQRLERLDAISEKVGNGWIVSRRTSIGTRARIANVAC